MNQAQYGPPGEDQEISRIQNESLPKLQEMLRDMQDQVAEA